MNKTNKTKKPEWEEEYELNMFSRVDTITYHQLKAFIKKVEAQARQSTIDEVIGMLDEEMENIKSNKEIAKIKYSYSAAYLFEIELLKAKHIKEKIQSLSKTGGKL